jgi:hypothetical protein
VALVKGGAGMRRGVTSWDAALLLTGICGAHSLEYVQPFVEAMENSSFIHGLELLIRSPPDNVTISFQIENVGAIITTGGQDCRYAGALRASIQRKQRQRRRVIGTGDLVTQRVFTTVTIQAIHRLLYAGSACRDK